MKHLSLLSLLLLLSLPLAAGCGEGLEPDPTEETGRDGGNDAPNDGGEDGVDTDGGDEEGSEDGGDTDGGDEEGGEDGGDTEEEATTFTGPNPDAAPLTVRTVYLVPSDRLLREEYVEAISATVLQLQGWYRRELGNGTTFRVNRRWVVETLQSDKPAAWFNAAHGNSADPDYDFFHNTHVEMTRILGSSFDTFGFTYMVYVDAAGATPAGWRGLAALPDHVLQGLTGQMSYPLPFWIGVAGHELGHAFGLPHPANLNPYAMMWTGYSLYPECILQDADREILSANRFFLPF